MKHHRSAPLFRAIVETLEDRCLLSSATVTTIQPANGATGVPRDSAITADLTFPNGALNGSTVNTGTVLLYRTSDHASIPSVVNTTGGSDAIILQPSMALDPSTSYSFQITSGVHDNSGAAVMPYTMSFTTGTTGAPTDTGIAFTQVALPTAQNVTFTTVRIGPDHELWAGALDGRIFRYPINADGTLGNPQVITSLQTAEGGQRSLTGFAFDPASTATNPILWVSNSGYPLANQPEFSSKITRLSGGVNLPNVQDIVINLPRSVSDHMTDQPVFGPDGALYFCQAAMNSMGGADLVWGNRTEHLLSSAILRLDTGAALALGYPINALTSDVGGTYDPNAPGAPLRIYATGVRNAFQLLWTADGHLLAPVNGASAGGNIPAGPSSPAISNVQIPESDYLYNITYGGYYGHPNPSRNQFVLDGGNPTAGVDPAEFTAYPVGTQPDPNYQPPVYDFGLHRSPDGIIQYTGTAFNGALNGRILVAEESAGDDIVVLTPGPNGTITFAQHQIPGLTGFDNPVNLVEDPATGFIYVAEYGGNRLTLLIPSTGSASVTTSKSVLAFNAIVNSGASPAQTLTITDAGSSPLTLGSSALNIVNDPSVPTQDAGDFAITNLGSVPATLAPGQSATLNITFHAPSVNLHSALLQIHTNDPSTPVLQVTLRGLGTTGTGGGNEPSLAAILRAYEVPTIVGDGPNDVNAYSSTFYPNPPDASSQEVVMQRLVKANSGPVTIVPLASFANTNQPVSRIGYYVPGEPSNMTELFYVNQSDSQTMAPPTQGSTSFDPGSSAFGLYAVFPNVAGVQHIAYSEDALNTWDATVSRKVRFFPLENPNGSVVPNAYVFSTEDNNKFFPPNIQPYDSNDFVGIIYNVKAAPGAPNGPVLGLTNPDAIPGSSTLVFNRIQNPNSTSAQNPPGFRDTVHDTNTLQIQNTGNQPLVINSLSLSDSTNWQIVNPPAAGTSIAPGGSLTITIKFVATSAPSHTDNQTNDTQTVNGVSLTAAGGVWNGTLTINSNDPTTPSRSVPLAGYWQNMSENENEPGLQTIVNRLFGYGTVISNTYQPNYQNNGTTPVLYGEEVASGLWQSADPTLPVSVVQLNAFHTQWSTYLGQLVEPATTLYWYPQGGGWQKLFQDQPGESQSLLPFLSGSSTAASASFSPTGVFGFNIDGEDSQDKLNTTDINTYGRSGHAVRFWPMRDASGNIIPNTWLMVNDYQNSEFDNSDYQDNVYVVTNMHPAAQPATPTDLNVVTALSGGLQLQWAPVSGGSIAYNVFRASSASGPFVQINTSTITQPSYTDSSAPVGSASYYRVVAVDRSSGAASIGATASGTATTSGGTPSAGLSAPIGVVATATSTTAVSLIWQPVSGATSYNVLRLAPGDTVFKQVATGVTSTSLADSGLTAGSTYQYEVQATNASGSSPNSTPISITLPGDTTQPPPIVKGIHPDADFGTVVKGQRHIRASLAPTTQPQLIYAFTLTNPLQRVVIHLSGLKKNADLELLDVNGNVILRSHRPRRQGENISLKMSPGTYYIKVYLIDSAATPLVLNLQVTKLKVPKPKAPKPAKSVVKTVLAGAADFLLKRRR